LSDFIYNLVCYVRKERIRNIILMKNIIKIHLYIKIYNKIINRILF